MNPISISKYLHFLRIDENRGITAAWNRFYPAVFIMNDYSRELLDSLNQKKKIPKTGETHLFIRELFKFKFAFRGGEDPSKNGFISMMDAALCDVKDSGDEFFREKKPYSGITILNDECNLECPYCVGRYKFDPDPCNAGYGKKRKLETVKQCFRQLLANRTTAGSNPVRVFFSGGEVLLEWPVINELVPWLVKTYKSCEFRFHMNTNLTVMTEEIARFLDRYDFKIDISIDGYADAHDRVRVYHDGRGSFADVIENLALYRKFNNTKNPGTFQGTIHDIDSFVAEEVYRMESYGFSSARLAPNLLHTTREDATKKAAVMERFLELNHSRAFQVTELFFINARNLLNRDEYRFTFNCRGLSGGFPEVSLKLNLSSLRVSLLCPYAREASVSLKDLGNDIYNRELWNRTLDFITKRTEALRKHCFSCKLLGMCRGGCIYTGLDNENHLNSAACTYQEKMWEIYIRNAAREIASA